MKISDTLKIVTRNLKRRKGRTILTSIGVTIGTAAIVAMLSLTIGLKENVVKSVSKLGNFTEIEVFAGYNAGDPRTVPQLNHQAIETIKLIPGVSQVMPRLRFPGQVGLQFGRKVGNVSVIGVGPDEYQVYSTRMEAGRYLSGRNQAVISSSVPDLLGDKEKRTRRKSNTFSQPVMSARTMSQVTKLFRPNLINKNIDLEIKKMNDDGQEEARQFSVTVVGSMSGRSFFSGGGTVFVPLEMVKEMNHWAGRDQNRLNRPDDDIYDTLVVNVPDRNRVEDVVNQIKAMGYGAFSPATELQAVNTVFLVVQIVLGGIGAISLLVATIGIINTMVMSILERTREIGIMKVLGATIPNIRHMFIIEAGTIGFLGGVAGLLLSYSIAGIINLVFKFIATREPNWDGVVDHIAVIPWWLTLSALAFASVVGILAGIYPAMRAAKLSPLNAIRQE